MKTPWASVSAGPCLRFRGNLLWLCLWLSSSALLVASPAPAPLLQEPANEAIGTDPDVRLCWRWIDNLIANGSFETGMTPGWYTGGSDPTVWRICTTATNTFVTTVTNLAPSGKLIQDFQIPADATSAMLEWKMRIWNPASVPGRLWVSLCENGGTIKRLEFAYGTEPIFRSFAWVSRSTNILEFKGRNLQLVIEAYPVENWFAHLDDFTLTCEHSSTPQFEVYAGKNRPLRASDQVGLTTNLNFSSVALEPDTVYYWMVGAVRDEVVNYSRTNSFKTGQRALPRLSIAGFTENTILFRFLSRDDRFYTIEQREALDPGSPWSDATGTYPGTGYILEPPALLPPAGCNLFWRLRVSPYR